MSATWVEAKPMANGAIMHCCFVEGRFEMARIDADGVVWEDVPLPEAIRITDAELVREDSLERRRRLFRLLDLMHAEHDRATP